MSPKKAVPGPKPKRPKSEPKAAKSPSEPKRKGSKVAPESKPKPAKSKDSKKGESELSKAIYLSSPRSASVGSGKDRHHHIHKSYPTELHCLVAHDMIFLEQMYEEGEKLPGMELDNQYILRNTHGQRILLASENTSFWFRCCFGANRPFEVNVYNENGNRIFNIERRLTFGLCCLCGICCGNKVEVTYDSGEVIGYVRHVMSCRPTFEVSDDTGKVLFWIRGPAHTCVCCKVSFKIFTAEDDPVEIGLITKQWGGVIKESFSDVDTFGIQFPKKLRPEYKAVLIGSTFLIDFTYFESRG